MKMYKDVDEMWNEMAKLKEWLKNFFEILKDVDNQIRIFGGGTGGSNFSCFKREIYRSLPRYRKKIQLIKNHKTTKSN